MIGQICKFQRHITREFIYNLQENGTLHTKLGGTKKTRTKWMHVVSSIVLAAQAGASNTAAPIEYTRIYQGNRSGLSIFATSHEQSKEGPLCQ